MNPGTIISERRVWTGEVGLDLSIAAVLLPDASVRVESRYVRYGDGDACALLNRSRMSLGWARCLGVTVQQVLLSATPRVVIGVFDDEVEEEILAEAALVVPRGQVRVVVAAVFGVPHLFIEQVSVEGERAVTLALRYERALGIRAIIDAVADIAAEAVAP